MQLSESLMLTAVTEEHYMRDKLLCGTIVGFSALSLSLLVGRELYLALLALLPTFPLVRLLGAEKKRSPPGGE